MLPFPILVPARACRSPFAAVPLLAFVLVATAFVGPAPVRAQQVTDIAIETRFQGDFSGVFARGRALIAADFDLDGQTDLYVGNPGDPSYILRGLSRNGRTRFLLTQILLKDALAWSGSAADYDNDGDYDLYVSCGANEGECFDYLFKNMLMEEGQLRFEDVTAEAGINGPVPPGGTDPIPVASANGSWGDYDRDGDLDLFVSVNIWNGSLMDGPILSDRFRQEGRPLGINEDILGRNVLWRNNGDGTFTDVTDDLGLGATLRPTRHSTFLDIDNDGDLDIYENNNGDMNVVWRNLLVENGTPSFEDVTALMSLPGEDMSYPFGSFTMCAADFNNDGWEDIFAFTSNDFEDLSGSPYGSGHALFINQDGTGFMNLADQAEVNNPFIPQFGVMGSQIGDLNGDGTPDIYVGNGGPSSGQFDQLYLSDTSPGMMPHYVNRSDLIDFPAPVNERSSAVYPPYPYRTHGTTFLDIDGDGMLEILVNQGGPAELPANMMQEPNRLFKFTWGQPINYFRIRPVGDGVHVSKDAVGARVKVTVTSLTDTWSVYQTLYAGHCFSAQNGFSLHFLIGPATSVDEVEVTWPDGTTSVITEGLAVNSDMVVEYTAPGEQPRLLTASEALPKRLTPAAPLAEIAADAVGETSLPQGFELSDVYPNPFNPRARFTLSVNDAQPVRIAMYDLLGRQVALLHDGVLNGGQTHSFTINGANLPSGVYLVRATGRTFTASRRVTLLK